MVRGLWSYRAYSIMGIRLIMGNPVPPSPLRRKSLPFWPQMNAQFMDEMIVWLLEFLGEFTAAPTWCHEVLVLTAREDGLQSFDESA